MKNTHSISRREFLKAGVAATVGGVLCGAGILAYAGKIEPSWIEVTRIDISIAGLPPALQGYRITHVSDIHFDDVWMTKARLSTLISMVNALTADAIVLTGDFVLDLPVTRLQPLYTHLRALQAPHIFACLGNHDHRLNAAFISGLLEAAGVRVLQNECVTVQHRGASLCFAGLDDLLYHAGNLPLLLARMPAGIPTILLAHEPDIADITAKTRRFALQLSGHSHGGQVIPPNGKPLSLPAMGQKYPLGLYRVGDMWQYTNRGIGMIPPRVRFNCRPEITHIRLTGA